MNQESTSIQLPDISQLMGTLARLQGIPLGKPYNPLSLLQKEIMLLKRMISEGMRSRNSELESIRQKLGNIEEDMCEEINEADNFSNDLDKNLKATEKECKKKMQILQKARLQRQIQIKTLIDTKILQILDEKKQLSLQDYQMQQLTKELAQLQAIIVSNQKRENETILKLKLQLIDMNSEGQRQVKALMKQRQNKIKYLKQNYARIKQINFNKIVQLKAKRQYTQNLLIAEIDTFMNKIAQRT